MKGLLVSLSLGVFTMLLTPMTGLLQGVMANSASSNTTANVSGTSVGVSSQTNAGALGNTAAANLTVSAGL